MKLFKKTTMGLALSATMIGGLGMSQQASALPYPVEGIPYLNQNGLGQILVFPYYSVRDGLKSFFNITNTSGDTVAVKVRFHEGLNSRDALDFIVVLSPQDVWSGWVEDGEDGPLVKSQDKSCVVGAPNIRTNGQALSNVAYADVVASFEDQGTNSMSRTREGYVEVISMGKVTGAKTNDGAGALVNPAFNENAAGITQDDLDAGQPAGGSVAYNAYHVNGIPRNCEAVNAAFVAGSIPGSTAKTTLPVDFPFTDVANPVLGDGDALASLEFEPFTRETGNPDNPLKGNFSLINADSGIGAGNPAIAIADFMALPLTVDVRAGDPANVGINLITAQNFPYFLEPTYASGMGLWNTVGLLYVENALRSGFLANEWANNPITGALTDWIVTFPTKGFHVDHKNANGAGYFNCVDADGMPISNVVPDRSVTPATCPTGVPFVRDNIQASNNRWRVSSEFFIGFVFEDNLDAEGADVKISLVGYDREELSVIPENGDTTPSPYPPIAPEADFLSGEANVISFGEESALGAKNYVLNFNVGDLLGNNALNGWATVKFMYEDTQQDFPVVGYAFKSRNQGDASKSYSQIMGHAWANTAP